jgi:uncharacterized membrane protein
MMWLVGAVAGIVLGLMAGSDAWIAGGILGGIVGWMLDRRPAGALEKRLLALERHMDDVQSELRHVERRLSAMAGGEPLAEEAPSATASGAAVSGAPAAAEAGIRAPIVTAALFDKAPAVATHAATPALEEGATPPPEVAPRPLFDDALARAPRLPRLPNLTQLAWRWLTGGNTVVRVGVVILFFGVAFLLKYAYARVQVPITLRLSGAAAGAIVLLVFGWQLRTRRAGYALALQGGGVGILYLVIFAAFRLYRVLPATPAFVLLVCVAAFSAFLAVAQDSLALAVLGVSGGFLAPILASTGAGSHVALFSYYAVLNAGILGVALFKSWRLLNVVGYVFTFGIGTLWGVQYYRPEHFASTEPFLVLFFVFYVAIPLLFARREAGRQARYLDATLVFGVPLVAFGLQVGLVHDIEYGAAWSAVAVGATYLLLARGVWKRAGEGMRMLAEAFLALGVVFVTLAIPLAVEGRWTSAVWALEGAAIVWVGVRQQRLPARAFGIALQVLAGLAFASDTTGAATMALANSFYLGCLFLAVGGLSCAWYLARRAEAVTRAETVIANFLFAWGVGWWALGAAHEIGDHVSSSYQVHAWTLFCTASCLVFSQLHQRIAWHAARYVALALLPLLAMSAVASIASLDAHPFAHLGYVAWPAALVAHVLILRWHEAPASTYQYWVHAAGVWLWTALASCELAWAIDQIVQGETVWPLIAWALVPGAVIAFLGLRGARIVWPIAAWRDAYLVGGAAPVAGFLALWWIVVNFVSDGDPAPLPYVPVLNPLDLAQVGVVLVVALWLVQGRRLGLPLLARLPFTYVQLELAAAAFVWANAVLLRTLHHWAGVPFDLDAMLRSSLVQTSFSLLWSLMALGTMVMGTRRHWRAVWIAGAGILAAVVVKLFIVDLASVGTIERIVSFLAVGIFMLIVGYFSPVPPRAREIG